MTVSSFRAPALALLCLAGAAQASEQAIIVLDGSGSMWGQINGKPKLEIARETLATVLRDAPPDMALGLVAYGHREKGNCADIELVVPVRAGSAGAIADAAADMKFLGMTPLSDAVARAAQELRFTEQKATVILITDGLETCKADPCALGKELEASGVDFTAHVVGFGLSAEEGRQVACLAENTGGRYLAANDADALAAALTETVVEAPPAPPAPEATLEAPEQVPMSSRFKASWTGPAHRYDEVQVFDPAGNAGRGKVIDNKRVLDGPGADQRQVELVAPAKPGRYLLRYYHGAMSRVIATRELEVVEAAVSLEAPEEVAIASSFVVGWTGPGERYDEVQVVDPAGNAGRGKVIDNRRVQTDKGFDQRQVTLTAPAKPGEYTLRYWNGDNSTALSSRSLRVVATEVALDAPASVPMASYFTVTWTGPGARYDEVQVVNPAGNAGRGKVTDNQRVQTDKGYDQRQVTMTAPAKPGTYQLRYYNGDNSAVLMEQPLQVEPVEVRLDAPASGAAGQKLTVAWTGPGARYDEVQVFDPAGNAGRGKVLANRRVQSDPGYDERRATLTLPDKPGRYELRYWNGDNSALLHSQPFSVE
jgi:Ca-activated chloride channel family protein